MNKSADYGNRLAWLQWLPSPDTSTGQLVNHYQHHGYLRCAISEDSGRRQDEDGATRTGAQGTIRIRQYPAITVNDLLYQAEFDWVWIIDSIHYGDNEVICDVYRLDQGGIDDYHIEGDDS